MNPHLRTAYLHALGVEVWLPKAALAVSPSRQGLELTDLASAAGNEAIPSGAASTFFVEPGTSDTLLLCGGPAEATSVLARDIARSLKAQPVWGWAVSEGSAGGLAIEQAIGDRLITRLIVFGEGICDSALANAGADGNAGVVGTAEVLRVASLPALAGSGTARRALWEVLQLRQWDAARARVFASGPDGGVEG